ncbi:MAG: molybdenum cofactor guanylyltransferase MobA [Magnetococcales bacterium]|nr:molybdenum cofactor guanylyltransferase MobA [Magnetococcales bacterium]
MTAPLTAVILAGGLSRRMNGVAKGTLPLAGEAVIQHVIRRLLPQVSRIIINANDQQAYQSFGLPLIPDQRPDYAGPLAGVEAALQSVSEEWILTVAVDIPFLPHDLVAILRQQAVDAPVTVSSRGRCHPVVCLWPRTVLPNIRNALDKRAFKLVQWFSLHPHVVVPFADWPGGVDPFFNLNQPDQLLEAEGWLSKLAGAC